jgi:hypothetical protein
VEALTALLVTLVPDEGADQGARAEAVAADSSRGGVRR